MNLLIMNMKNYLQNSEELSASLSKDISNDLFNEKRNRPDKYETYVNNLLGSIELIMFYYKNLRPPE